MSWKKSRRKNKARPSDYMCGWKKKKKKKKKKENEGEEEGKNKIKIIIHRPGEVGDRGR